MVCNITLADVKNKNVFNGIDFRECTFLKKNRIRGKSFVNCNFEEVKLNESTFIDSKLKNSNFKLADLSDANFKGADLTGANLEHAKLYDTNLENTLLTRANLVNLNSHTANFRNSYLANANLRHASLFKANFTDADLTDADCTNIVGRLVRFKNATLRRANFTGADLAMSEFTEVDLRGANLTRANLTRVDLTGANLTGAVGADLTGAIGADLILGQPHQPQQPQQPQQEKKTKDLLKKIIKIVPHPINKNHIKYVKNTFENKVFDVSMAMEIPITEIDDEEDNVIFYIDNQPTGFLYPREQLKTAYNDYTSIFIACDKFNASAVSINVAKIDILIRINLTMNFFINLKDMIEVLSTNHKEWLIQDTNKIENFTASILNIYDKHSISKIGYLTGNDGERFEYSHNIMNTQLNIVSSDHCQDGTTQRIYKITPIKLTIPNIRIPTPIRNPTPVASIRIPTPIRNPTPVASIRNSTPMPTPIASIRNSTPMPTPIPIPPPRGKRCPNGTQKNKITGNCDQKKIRGVPVPVPVNVPVALRKRCPNGTRKNKRTGDCDPY